MVARRVTRAIVQDEVCYMNGLISSLVSAIKLSPSEIGYEGGITDPDASLSSVLNIVYTLAGVVCVIVLIISGYLFVTARGDAAQMKRAKDSIRSAVIGIVVVAVAFTLTQFILGRFQ